MESEQYWIYEDYFIFKPKFYDEINIYQNQLVNYKKLIFSDYDDYKICIETNNKFKVKYYHSIFKDSKFNQPLANSLDKLINLQQLTFGSYFNQLLGNSLDKLINLQKLTFGACFNQLPRKFLKIFWSSRK